MADVVEKRLAFPQLLILYGPKAVGKTTLANMLIDYSGAAFFAASLKYPLRCGCVGTFFDCDPALDLTLHPDQTTLDGDTAQKFMNAYHHFLISRYGASVLGRLAYRTIEEGFNFVPSFVVDDGGPEHNEDLAYLTGKLGSENCLIVNMFLEEKLAPPGGLCAVMDFHNTTTDPEQLLASFAEKYNA